MLVTFVLKMKNIFEIDFYVDPLASMLLRKVYLDTEKVEDAILEDVSAQLRRNEEEKAAAASGTKDDDADELEA